jgi:hypothetical protein
VDQAWSAGTHAAICAGVTSYVVVGDPVEVVGEPVGDVVGDVVGEVVGDVVGEVVGDVVGESVGVEVVGDADGVVVGEVVGESVGVEVLVVVGEDVAGGPEALVNGAAARTGAQAVASFFAAAFIAARACCIGAGSGIVTAVEPDVPARAPLPDPVEPVDAPVEPVDPDADEAADEVRPDDPDAPDPVDPVPADDPEEPVDPAELVVVVVWSVVSWACAWSNAA